MNRRTFLKWLGASGALVATNPQSVLAEGVEIVETPQPVDNEITSRVPLHPKYDDYDGYGNLLTASSGVTVSGTYTNSIVMSGDVWIPSDYDCPKCQEKLEIKSVGTVGPIIKQDVKCNCGYKGQAIYR